jgi:thiamine biosynthesis lipoprotein
VRAAEAELRQVEAQMSNWLEDSEVSRLRAAGAGVEVPLSADTRAVLQAAREAFEPTDRAFDITCRPLVELWRRAGESGALPGAAEVAGARAGSRWEDFELTASGAVKRSPQACVDLGGIAKGYGIDRALQAMRRFGLRGGLVDVGGDVACFGRQPGGQPWLVAVKNPAGPAPLARLRVDDVSVATSGDYARYVEIEGKRCSHIIDPRSGRPAAAARSATTVAPTALAADIWATALTVLGADGLARLPPGVEAMVVWNEGDAYRCARTPGFRELTLEPLPETIPATPCRQP